MTTGNPHEVPQRDDQSRTERAADLLPAYALGALDDDERELVEAELRESETMRAEHRRYQQTVDSLAAATPISRPPETLRERILTSAGSVPEPVPLPSRRSRWTRIALAAAGVLVFILGGVIAGLWNELNERDDRIAALEESASRRGTDFSQPLVWSTLNTAAADDPNWGYFCRTQDGSVGWIVVEGMPVTADYVYQLWLVDDEGQVSAGVFATDAEGRGFGVVRSDMPLTSFKWLWITAEPPGGSPAPTGDPRVSVTIV